MSKQLRLDVAQLTDVGRKRPHNEDNMAYVIPKDAQVMAKKGALFIVADGMGGHAAGEVASEIAVDTVSNTYYQDDNEDIAVSLLHAIKRANTLIHQRAAENMSRSGMGTTCVSAVLRDDIAYIANVGDSRAYLIRAGHVKQVSQDHSWVEEQVRAGLLTRDQARSHAQRNVITRCLGTQAEVDVDVFTEQLVDGDTLILCSDGLSGLVNEDDLRSIVGKYMPQESVYRLVERANENGGPDNITAIVIRVSGEPYPVSVGSRDVSSEATTLGRIPSATLSLSPRIDEAFTQPMPPARLSGPLSYQERPVSPRPAFPSSAKAGKKRSILPVLVLLGLLLIALAGGAAYYFLRHSLFSTASIDSSLTDATAQIAQAKNTLNSSNASDALKLLTVAQKDLRTVQHAGSLSSTQTQKFNHLQSDFIATTQQAITLYNQQALIANLPCSTTSISSISNGSTNTQPGPIASLKDTSGSVSRYTLGDNHKVYQIDTNFSLVNPLGLNGDPQVLLLASSGDHLLALTTSTKANNTTSYSLVSLSSKGQGKLDQTSNILDSSISNGQVPSLLSAWTGDVYIVLTSPTASNSATLLDFPLGSDNKLGKVQTLPLSITTSIVSMAAFPDHQLFLLTSDGSVQSLQFKSGDHPSPVAVQHPFVAPLTVNAKDFSLKTDVPAPGPPTPFVSVPDVSHRAFLTAGLVDNTPQLYLVDGSYHRVMAFQIVQNQDATASTTATVAASTATPSQAPGGGVATSSSVQSPLTMTLVHQYVSSALLSAIKGVAADPKDPKLYLVASNGQNPPVASLVALDTSVQNACMP